MLEKITILLKIFNFIKWIFIFQADDKEKAIEKEVEENKEKESK